MCSIMYDQCEERGINQEASWEGKKKKKEKKFLFFTFGASIQRDSFLKQRMTREGQIREPHRKDMCLPFVGICCYLRGSSCLGFSTRFHIDQKDKCLLSGTWWQKDVLIWHLHKQNQEKKCIHHRKWSKLNRLNTSWYLVTVMYLMWKKYINLPFLMSCFPWRLS